MDGHSPRLVVCFCTASGSDEPTSNFVSGRVLFLQRRQHHKIVFMVAKRHIASQLL
jgi:hypothetical protein